MACRNAGFPAQSSTVGVKLVAGFSQTVMVEVMTGDYSTTIDETTGAVKVAVTPLDSFMKTMNHESFDHVRDTLVELWNRQKGHVHAPIHPEEVSGMKSQSYDEIIADLEQKIEVVTSQKENEQKARRIEELITQLSALESI